MVFAAASLRDVLSEAGSRFAALGELPPDFNFAGSNLLARQIEAADGADLFLSANLEWLDYLEAAGRLVTGSRRDLCGNSLVLVARGDSGLHPASWQDLATVDYRYLAVADPEGVPAGIYARQALRVFQIEDGSLWQAVSPRLAPTVDVRAALSMAQANPEVLALVYRSDLRGANQVEILLELPSSRAPDIRYGVALVEGGRQQSAGQRFLDFLLGDEGQQLLEDFGFRALREGLR